VNELARLRDAIGEQPREIRICCPRGHFIADVELVASGDDTATLVEPILMLPSGPSKAAALTHQSGAHGFWALLDPGRHAAGSKTVQLACTHSRCRYRGVFSYVRLAIELASAALAGDREYRPLT
jgi:hypothetical protein